MTRIYDRDGLERNWEWLRGRYGPMVRAVLAPVGPGLVFRAMRIDDKVGPSVLTVRVLGEDGQPRQGQPVANAWPEPEMGGNVVDLRGAGLKRLYADVACVQRTEPTGYTGFGLGTGSYIKDLALGGPHTVWVCSGSADSDAIMGIGMLGGTEHEGPLSVVFQLVDGSEPPDEPPDDPGEGPGEEKGKGSRLAWHFQSIPGWASRVVNSKWVKVIDPPPVDYFAGRRVIGRLYVPESEQKVMIGQGLAGAAQWAGRCIDAARKAPYVWCWEGPNEPDVSTPEARAALVKFTRQWVKVMHQNGLRTVALCLSVGWPDVGTAGELAGALEESDYWSVHEYAAPRMDSGQSWYCLRYQRTVAELRVAGARIPPLIISECGIDGGVAGRPGVGWKGYTTREDYLEQLKWYDGELRKDDTVLAATVFTSGPNADWQQFDMDEELSKSLAAYVASVEGDVPNDPPDDPPDQPPDEPPDEPPADDPGGLAAVVDAIDGLGSVLHGDLVEILNALRVDWPGAGGPEVSEDYGLARPVRIGDVSQWFGERPEVYGPELAGHEGIDYGVPVGTAVYAAHSGKVEQAHGEGVYGIHVVVWDEARGVRTVYGHLSALTVAEGDCVCAGDQVGKSGNSGRTEGPHLHFGWQVRGVRNPAYGDWLDPALGRLLYG